MNRFKAFSGDNELPSNTSYQIINQRTQEPLKIWVGSLEDYRAISKDDIQTDTIYIIQQETEQL